jgi:succinate dehydrogenase / fumarate reductase membrane anchor subunit
VSGAFRTPLARARGLGSAKTGVARFIIERVSAAALIPLLLWALWSAPGIAAGGYDAATAWIAAPVNAALLALLVIVGAWHMRLGMAVVIEDYIHRPTTKAALLTLNLFACWGAVALAVASILKAAIAGGAG